MRRNEASASVSESSSLLRRCEILVDKQSSLVRHVPLQFLIRVMTMRSRDGWRWSRGRSRRGSWCWSCWARRSGGVAGGEEWSVLGGWWERRGRGEEAGWPEASTIPGSSQGTVRHDFASLRQPHSPPTSHPTHSRLSKLSHEESLLLLQRRETIPRD